MIGLPCAWVTGVDHVTCSLCAGFRAEHDQIASRLAEMRGLADDGRSALVTDLEQLVGENCEWFEGETVHPTFLEPFGESLEGSRPAFVNSAVVLHFREASARIQEEAAALQSALAA